MSPKIDAALCPDTEALRTHIADLEPADREAVLIARCMRLELRTALLERVLEVVQIQVSDTLRLARNTLTTIHTEDP